ncbi:hypothetical protein OOJ91_12600 [Micromonospora lupini]|uniref:hypothetical protein n=1 Tax=Micromonospora lupini TaxID=285679 RepID=UPI002257351E|nr:hypothetical protein [Micromonospora lupini]MCX5066720.1 hypothetical protein [Micromonospora lupini]
MTAPDYARVRDELRAQLGRVDTKALGLSAINLGAVGLFGAALVRTDVPDAVRVGAGAGTAVVLWSLWRLLNAVAPILTGDYGFVAYARTNTPAQLERAIIADQVDEQREIRWLSRIVRRKYQAVRGAVYGLMYAPVVAALTAVDYATAVLLFR